MKCLRTVYSLNLNEKYKCKMNKIILDSIKNTHNYSLRQQHSVALNYNRLFICMFIMPYMLTCTVRQGLLDTCDQAVLCISPSAQLVNFIAASITLTVPPMMPFVYLTNVSYLPSIAPTICFAPSKSKIHKVFRFPFSPRFPQCQT